MLKKILLYVGIIVLAGVVLVHCGNRDLNEISNERQKNY